MSSAETGAKWEAAVERWLRDFGFPAFRLRGREGPRDHGDIGGFARWALDCKDHAKMSLASWVAQAAEEARNSGKPLSAVIVKRRGASPPEAYVVMSLATWARLEQYMEAQEEEIRRTI